MTLSSSHSILGKIYVNQDHRSNPATRKKSGNIWLSSRTIKQNKHIWKMQWTSQLFKVPSPSIHCSWSRWSRCANVAKKKSALCLCAVPIGAAGRPWIPMCHCSSCMAALTSHWPSRIAWGASKLESNTNLKRFSHLSSSGLQVQYCWNSCFLNLMQYIPIFGFHGVALCQKTCLGEPWFLNQVGL